MPVYEYRCNACQERFEKLVRSITQEPTGVTCPACQGQDVTRLISAPAVHVAGQTSSSSDASTAETPSTKPPLFGRKELNKTLKDKAK